MSIFQPITLSWHDKTHVIPAEHVLGAIAVVEEIVTLPEILMMMHSKPNFSKVSRAFGAVLRYAGVTVSDEEIYEGMFAVAETYVRVLSVLDVLAKMMTPPKVMQQVNDGAASEGNLARAKTARSRLSKRSTKPSSAAAT